MKNENQLSSEQPFQAGVDYQLGREVPGYPRLTFYASESDVKKDLIKIGVLGAIFIGAMIYCNPHSQDSEQQRMPSSNLEQKSQNPQ